jgi:transposase InsO family protein
VYADYNWYQNKYKKHFYEGVEIANSIRRYEAYQGGKRDKTQYRNKLAEGLGIKGRRFSDLVKLYQEAQAWAIKLEAEHGESYEHIMVLAVCRKPKEEKRFPSLSDEVKAFIENVLYSESFATNMQSVTNLYDDLEDMSAVKGWDIPSYDTVWRYCNHIWEQDGEGAKAMIARGLRYWKNRYMMKKYRNTEKLQVLEVLQGDVHTFDVWVSVKRPNGKLQAIRPCLVAWVDTRSRCLVGWKISEAPNAEMMKESLINVIYPKANPELPYGVPKYLLIDNGKEYTAETLTGRPRSVRVSLDADTVEDDMRSLPYQPWSKAQIERFFGTVCGKFSKKYASYTGTLSASRTESKINKDIKGMLESGELLDIEAFATEFEDWVVNKYHKRKHKGLMIQGETVPAPISVWNSEERYYKAAPPLDYTLGLLAKTHERKVTTMGIKITIGGRPVQYTNEQLHRFIGKRVQFRYYPQDITKVKVYDLEGRYVCDAVSYELLTIAPKLSEAGFTEHNKDQKRQQRDDKNTIIKRQMTHAEREEAKKTMLEEAGKKSVGPALAEQQETVTAMPKDTQYREEKARGKSEQVKKSAAKTKTYFDKQADVALEKLRKLG